MPPNPPHQTDPMNIDDTSTDADTSTDISSTVGRLSLITRSQTGVKFVPRPGFGTLGRATRVRSNYLPITRLSTSPLFHYDVAITPSDHPPPLYRKIWTAFVTQYRNVEGVLGGMLPVFDGRKNAFSARALPFGDAGTFDVVEPTEDDDDEMGVTAKNANGNHVNGRARQTIKIRLKKVAQINMAQLHGFFSGQNPSTPDDTIMPLDIVLRHLPATRYITVGRNFYTGFEQEAKSLGNGAEVFPGFHQSIRPAGNSMKINIDTCATAFYKRGPLVAVVGEVLGRQVLVAERVLSERDKNRLEKTLKGLRVGTNHRGAERKKFRIAKLGEPAFATRFSFNGNMISVAEYFKYQYHRDLQYPFLPVLCVGNQKHNVLPMEVVDVIPGQRHTRKLSPIQTAEMIRQTCQPPYLRAGKIASAVAMFEYADNEYMQEFGIQVSNDLQIVPGRILPTPMLEYARGTREMPKEGCWNWRGKKFEKAAQLDSWAVVVFLRDTECTDAILGRFIKELIRTFTEVGLRVTQPNPLTVHANPASNIQSALKQAGMRALQQTDKPPQIIFCVLPNTGVPLYAEIMRVSDTIIGLPTQCVQMRHVQAAKKQYCVNLALKVNPKLGGENVIIHHPQMQFMRSRATLIFGCDITHPAGSASKKPSVISLVGSSDPNFTKYAASVRVRPKREIYKNELAGMIIELLKNFYHVSGVKPERLIFYRTGISEGQFGETLASEVTSIRRACHVLARGYRPALTYIVVQKRHHTRFFPVEQKDADRSGNCLPGLVVEREIGHPNEVDFWMMGHPGLQGTSRPCHYNILYDESSFPPDIIQDLTYKLGYLYARSTRAVSIVTPAYYASIVSSRARFHQANGGWSDGETESSDRGQGQWGSLKPELFKCMWYM